MKSWAGESGRVAWKEEAGEKSRQRALCGVMETARGPTLHLGLLISKKHSPGPTKSGWWHLVSADTNSLPPETQAICSSPSTTPSAAASVNKPDSGLNDRHAVFQVGD